jgi:hypothetical protein
VIEAKLYREDGILEIVPRGTLEITDFDRLRLLVDPYIRKHGKLDGLLIHVESFPGWESFSALLSHLKFVNDHHESIRRVATVTDNAFLSILPRVGDYFIKAEVRHFAYADREKAIAWLKGAGVE